MSQKPLMPSTRTGRWGFWLIIASAGLVALSMAMAYVANVVLVNQGMENQAFSMLGILGALFLITTIVALVLSWLAILRFKDRSVILIIFTIALTLIALFMAAGEIIEGISMSNS